MRRWLSGRVVGVVLIVGSLLALALWPTSIAVDTACVVRGPLVVTVNEEGQTRIRNRFVVSAPVAGRVQRIELEPGDVVRAGDVVARVRPESPPLLDARTRAEAQAAIDGAKAAVGRVRAEEERARTALGQAERELQRARSLVSSGAIALQEVERREDEASSARDALKAVSFAVRAADSELQRAEARLATPAGDRSGRVVIVTSPIAGTVLQRVRQSESVVPAGEPLLEIGDPADLEVVAGLLSTDAVRVQPGARALVEQWGGDRELDARVRRVEPAGFTKISALGVEEQRVNVLLDFVNPAAAWNALGDAYRVEVGIVTWESPHVLKVPTSALFRVGTSWAVYIVDGGRVRMTVVELGRQTGQEAEVKFDLRQGEYVVVHPPDTLTDGARITVRSGRSGG